MKFLMRPDPWYPQKPWRYAFWHTSKHPAYMTLLAVFLSLALGLQVLVMFQSRQSTTLDGVLDRLLVAYVVTGGVIIVCMFGVSLRTYLVIRRGDRCPGCLVGKTAGEPRCSICGTEWAECADRPPHDTEKIIVRHAGRHAFRHPAVLAAAGAYVFFFVEPIVNITTGHSLFGLLGIPWSATRGFSVFLGLSPLVYIVFTQLVGARIQRENLCPRCLYAMARDAARCHECGRVRSSVSGESGTRVARRAGSVVGGLGHGTKRTRMRLLVLGTTGRAPVALGVIALLCLILVDAILGVFTGVSAMGAMGVLRRHHLTVALLAALGAIVTLRVASVREEWRRDRKRCPTCGEARTPGDRACAGCGTPWRSSRSDDAWKHASRHTLRHPVVRTGLGILGLALVIMAVNWTTGWPALPGAQLFIFAYGVVFVMIATQFTYTIVYRRARRLIRDEHACPNCLYILGPGASVCPECGRERGASA